MAEARQAQAAAAGVRRNASGALERLPKWLICVPLVFQWLYLAARHGSATLPSCANPCLTAGGLVGEAKLEYLEAMGPVARVATAAWCAILPGAGRLPQAVNDCMLHSGLSFPVMAKPDLGMCGFGVRLIADAAELASYLEVFPERQVVVLQTYLPDEGEAGIFYARHPDQAEGKIIGLALRHFPQVTGNGVNTVGELIAQDDCWIRVITSCAPKRVPSRVKAKLSGWPRWDRHGSAASTPTGAVTSLRSSLLRSTRLHATCRSFTSAALMCGFRHCANCAKGMASGSWRSMAPAPKQLKPGTLTLRYGLHCELFSPSNASCF
jgi:hypothetical protein